MKSKTSSLIGLLLLAIPAFMHAQSGSGDGYNYSINASNANTITITNYTGLGGAVTIPTNINGLTVTSIEGTPGGGLGGGYVSPFKGTSLTSVTIPSSMTSIGEYAFNECTSLTNVTIANSVASIGEDALNGCTSLNSIYFQGNAPALGSSVFSGDNNAIVYDPPCATGWSNTFGGLPVDLSTPATTFIYTTNAGAITITGYAGSCSTVIIPATIYGLPVTTIGTNAFQGTANMISLIIPGSVTSIGGYAFSDCTSLTSVYFQGNAPATYSTVFVGDNNTIVYYTSGTTGWSSPFAGVPAVQLTPASSFTYTTNAGAITITGYTGSGGAVGIPPLINGLQVTSIGNGDESVFNPEVTNVTIPNGVTSIAQYAFENCTGLNSVSISDSVTSIGTGAFENCTSLASVTISDGVTNIEASAFYGCYDLISVSIAASVSNIGTYAFAYCTNLESAYFNGNAPTFDSGGPLGPTNTVFLSDNNAIIYYLPGTSGWGSSDPLPTEPIPYSFTANGNTITITTYTGSGGSLIIPSTINGLPVTSIGTNAFYDSTNLTSVIIPNGVTNIGSNAFMLCPALVAVAIPASVTSIGADAFADCTKMAALCFQGNAPSTDPTAFSSDSNATVYYLSGTYVWGSTFAGLPAVQTTPQAVFNWGTNGASISITGLNGFGVAVIIPPFINGYFVTSISNNAFADKTELFSVAIPPTVTNIGAGAFAECTALTNAPIPGNVTTIEEYAFQGCTNLTNMAIPSSVTSIGAEAFMFCSGLTNIAIPVTVTNIGENAFAACSSLTNVTIPACVTNFVNVFSACANLTNVTIANGVTSIGAFEFDNYNTLTSVTIPASVTSIGVGAFQECYGLPSVTIPTTVTNIGEDAFYACTALTNITIPGNVMSIGEYAFWNCTTLTNVTISSSVTNIGADAFQSCTNLAGIYFLGNAPTVGTAVFSNDFKATVYYLPGASGWSSPFAGLPAVQETTSPTQFSFTTNAGAITITSYSDSGGVVVVPASINGLPVTGIGNLAFNNCINLTNIIIPSSVTSIGNNAFANCSNLASITISASVTNIGQFAFEFCASLTNVTIPSSVASIGEGAFGDCTSLAGIFFQGNAPATGSAVFAGDSNAFITYLPCATGWGSPFAGLQSSPLWQVQYNFETNAGTITITGFLGLCENEAILTIPSTINGLPVTSIGSSAFSGAILTNVIIPDSVTSVGANAFYECSNLVNITIPSSITSFGNNAFYGSGLTSVTLPGGISSIGNDTFEYCASLTNITIPGSVTTLQPSAVQNCTNLAGIYFTGNAPRIGGLPGTFSGDNKATVYYLPGTAGWNSTFGGRPAMAWSPLIQTGDGSFGVQNNQFGFNITGTNNFTVVVEACTNLANPVWTPLQTVTLTNGSCYFSDPQWTNYPGRFYGLGLP